MAVGTPGVRVGSRAARSADQAAAALRTWWSAGGTEAHDPGAPARPGLEFESKGHAATTVDDIATAAGTTRQTSYLHFSSKSQVMQSLIQTVNQMLTGILVDGHGWVREPMEDAQ